MKENLYPGEFEKFKARCTDPSQLADIAFGWRDRMGITIRAAAEMLGMPARTLEGIEQGRGFRYPLMLVYAMIRIDLATKAVREANRDNADSNYAAILRGLEE